ncbi:MAG: hypothetical protein IPH75_08330 [bacterium]|nr:hypothetical protein [bacterium]
MIEYSAAREFILEYEWLGNMGTSKYCFGLMFGTHLAAVVCYGPLVAPSGYLRLIGLDESVQFWQLCRGASTYWAPKWSGSMLISRSLTLIRNSYGVDAVIAYADPAAGEIGTIYQASNAIYIGMTSPGGGKKYIINGKLYDPRKVHKKFGSRSRDHLLQIDPNYQTQQIHSKHRYLFLLGNRVHRRRLVESVRHLIRPYPKRKFGIEQSVAKPLYLTTALS